MNTKNFNLDLRDDVRCLRLFQKEENEFTKVFKRNEEKMFQRFDKVFTAA